MIVIYSKENTSRDIMIWRNYENEKTREREYGGLVQLAFTQRQCSSNFVGTLEIYQDA